MARGACAGFVFAFSVKIFLSKIERNGDRVGIGGDSVNFLLFVSKGGVADILPFCAVLLFLAAFC